jgi:hypothetical protein
MNNEKNKTANFAFSLVWVYDKHLLHPRGWREIETLGGSTLAMK